MREIIFATHNKNKSQEVKHILGNNFKVYCLADLNYHTAIPENEPTIQANASFKARFIFKIFNKDCFADDTGLEILALEGRPGVHSARYAGPNGTYKNIVNKVLMEMNTIEDRRAQFRTVISLMIDGKEFLFEGIIKGTITTNPQGNEGFGYDPIFIPNGYNKTFAQMTIAEKNQISHRAIAVKKLSDFLFNYH